LEKVVGVTKSLDTGIVSALTKEVPAITKFVSVAAASTVGKTIAGLPKAFSGATTKTISINVPSYQTISVPKTVSATKQIQVGISVSKVSSAPIAIERTISSIKTTTFAPGLTTTMFTSPSTITTTVSKQAIVPIFSEIAIPKIGSPTTTKTTIKVSSPSTPFPGITTPKPVPEKGTGFFRLPSGFGGDLPKAFAGIGKAGRTLRFPKSKSKVIIQSSAFGRLLGNQSNILTTRKSLPKYERYLSRVGVALSSYPTAEEFLGKRKGRRKRI
jgi:hypothetical protein